MSRKSAPEAPEPLPRVGRRTFLRRALFGAAALGAAATGYGVYEAARLAIRRETIAVRGLPAAFDGLRVALVTDLHHGPFTGLDFIRGVVEQVNAERPDVIVLGGDYVHRSETYVEPVFEVLAGLRAGIVSVGVLGNHDWKHGNGQATQDAMERAGIRNLTNRSLPITRGSATLDVVGVDDLWRGAPDLDRALGEVQADASCLLVAHNPDFTERVRDPRVGLTLSGHTHGGQVNLPGIGVPFVPSRFGRRFLHGLRTASTGTRVFVSRGVGVVGVPVRIRCEPEVPVLTLVRGVVE